MSIRRRGLSATVSVLAFFLASETALADEPAHGSVAAPPSSLPQDRPLDLAPIDIGTLEFAAGGIGAFDKPRSGSAELMAGLLLARIQFLGLSGAAGTFRAAFRPSLETGVLSGSLLSLDEMMFGSRYPDLKVCPGFPTIRCDQTSGFWGLGTTLLSFATDLGAHRSAIRVAEGDFVGSVTPAFGKDWARYRFLPRLGASVDWFSDAATGGAAWVGRAMLGFDSSFAIGPVLVRPSFRWRPNTSAFVHDYTLEPKLEIFARETWAAWHDRDALRIGVEIGFTHASVPENAFGPDLVDRAGDTFFARFVLAPTIFTFGPP